MRDDFGSPPLLAKEPLQEIRNRHDIAWCPVVAVLVVGVWCDHPGQGHRGARSVAVADSAPMGNRQPQMRDARLKVIQETSHSARKFALVAFLPTLL
jgi:hypothetical protein